MNCTAVLYLCKTNNALSEKNGILAKAILETVTVLHSKKVFSTEKYV